MRISTTLQLTPAPSTKGILSVVVMLYVYVLATQAQPVLFGRIADPITLAVSARLLLILAENSAHWPRLFRTFNRFRGPIASTLAVPFVAVAALLWFNSPLAAQIGWSVQLILTGAAGLLLTHFNTPSMKYIPSGFPKTHATAKPIHAFLSGSILLQGIVSALLARFGSDMAWIAYASAGWVLQFWMTNWLAMLWLIAHERDLG